jgi:hypothetical protein
MRPLTGARPAARDTSNSVGLRCSSRRRRARHTRSSGAQTHRRRRAATKPGRCASGENCYRWRSRVQAGTSGDAAPAGAAFRCRVVSALCVPARRLGAGRPRPLPRVVHHRLGVSLAVASLGGAGEQGHAPSFFAGSTSISPRELRREPGAQADSSARDALGGSRRRKGRTLEMRPWTSASQPHAHGRAARGSGAARATGRVG